MPRHPAAAPHITAIPGGVFSRFRSRIATLTGEVYPLHVGDTWMEPLPAARMEALTTAAHPGLHRYPPVNGIPELLAALAVRHGVDSGRILMTCGATGGLKAVAGAMLAPGEEVLILAPYWPLIAGIVATSNGTPVEVPFLDRGAGDIAGRLSKYLTDKTVAIYINSPNNPTGAVLSEAELSELAAFARAHDLWIWADEIYEHYAYTADCHPVAGFAPERTVSVFSFSKAYGLAGSRCGYLIGPDAQATGQIRKSLIHAFYSAPRASQQSALAALLGGDAWLADAAAQYESAGANAALTLGLPAPQGGTFLFFDVSDCLDERGLDGFLFDCLEENLILAPGASFGPGHYSNFVRLCFTAAPPEVVQRGVEKLAALIARSRLRALQHGGCGPLDDRKASR
ncbi:MAG: pyridoxal phosphate-dependent aminotransferase [Myxococcota bacterium]|nr:pyridoxal phosphate-dependent aminotransferase [Myxococcota bacterium]